MKKKIMFVFGTRPEAIKMAPLINEMKEYADKFVLSVVVTGQHRHMLDQVLRVFKIKPDHDLEIMAKDQTLVDIITKAMRGLEKVLLKEKPDMLLVQGDTSTAFASALLAFYYRIPVAHIEAGLRTFDKWSPFPEEINRKLISPIADLHFAPTATSMRNLLEEKVARKDIYLTGNTVIDALLTVSKRKFDLKKAGIKLDPKKKLILVTVHRRETLGDMQREMCLALLEIAKTFNNEVEIILPMHKNPKVRDLVIDILSCQSNIKLIEPMDYEPFVHLMKQAYIIITDSGGVQEEAPSLGKPVLVMREKTERPEAIKAGTVKLVGASRQVIVKETIKLLKNKKAYLKMSRAVNPYGDGLASKRMVDIILYYFNLKKSKPVEFKL